MAERITYPVTGRLSYGVGTPLNGKASAVIGQMGAIVTGSLLANGNVVQTNNLAAAIAETIAVTGGSALQTNVIAGALTQVISATGDLNVVSYTPSLNFSDGRNSQYLGVT